MTPQKLSFTRDQAARGDLNNLYLSIDWGQLDCLGKIKGVGGYAECLAGSEPVKLDGVEIRVLSLDTLIQPWAGRGICTRCSSWKPFAKNCASPIDWAGGPGYQPGRGDQSG